MTDREEMRRMIDVIEQSANSVGLEQAIEDIKTFVNAASFLTNKLDRRLERKDVKRNAKSGAPKPKGAKPFQPPAPPPTKTAPDQNPPSAGSTSGIAAGITQADFDRLKPQSPQTPIRAD
jgi:hypothetical protein